MFLCKERRTQRENNICTIVCLTYSFKTVYLNLFTSFKASYNAPFCFPKFQKQFKLISKQTCRNGSLIPLTSCSGVYPAITEFFSVLTSVGTHCDINI